MGNFLVTTSSEQDVYIIRPSGYIDEDGGTKIVQAVQSGMTAGYKKFILNFQDSPVINSQGIAQVIEIAEIVVDELNGDLALTDLSESVSGVFKMVGLFQIGVPYQTESDALNELKD